MQTFVSEQYALEAWEMKLFFVQTFYVNVDSRCSKNAEILGTSKIDKILGLKTLKNIDTGFTNLVYVFMLYKNRGLLMLTQRSCGLFVQESCLSFDCTWSLWKNK